MHPHQALHASGTMRSVRPAMTLLLTILEQTTAPLLSPCLCLVFPVPMTPASCHVSRPRVMPTRRAHTCHAHVPPAQQLLPANHMFWETAEVTNTVLYRYYDIPWISVGSAIYHLAAANASGFQPHELRVRDPAKGPFHYSARGHKYVADMVVHMVRQADAMRKSGLLDGQTDIYVDDGVQSLGGGALQQDAGGPQPQPRPSMLPALLHPIR